MQVKDKISFEKNSLEVRDSYGSRFNQDSKMILLDREPKKILDSDDSFGNISY